MKVCNSVDVAVMFVLLGGGYHCGRKWDFRQRTDGAGAD